MSSRVHATDFYKNLTVYALGGHSETIVGCFFEKDSLNVNDTFFINFLSTRHNAKIYFISNTGFRKFGTSIDKGLMILLI